MKTEKWPVDQLFLAADLLVETDWKVPKATDPRVAALAATVGAHGWRGAMETSEPENRAPSIPGHTDASHEHRSGCRCCLL
jgi:hypothetical protein